MRSLIQKIGDQPYVLLTLTVLFWAGNAVVSRGTNDAISPVALSYCRWTGAFLILAPFAVPTMRREWHIVRANIGMLVILSICGIAAFNTLLYTAVQTTTALNVVLLQTLMPAAILIMTVVFYRDKATGLQVLGLVVAFGGAMTVVVRGEPRVLFGLDVAPGDLWMLLAVLFYSGYSVLLKRRPALSGLAFAGTTFLIGSLLLLPLFLWDLVDYRFPPPGQEAVLAVAYVMVFPSIISYLSFNRGVQLLGPARAGMFIYILPLFGAILSVLFLEDRIQWFHAAGGVLIVIGIVLAESTRARH